MKRYTAEEKALALKSVEEIGAEKTSETTGIAAATLYRWKRDVGGTVPGASRRGRPKKKTDTAPRKKESKNRKDAAAEARALLIDNEDTAARMAQLEQENAKLREQNAKLRKALSALID